MDWALSSRPGCNRTKGMLDAGYRQQHHYSIRALLCSGDHARMFWPQRERALGDVHWCTFMHPCEMLTAFQACKLALCIDRLMDTAILLQHVIFISTFTPRSA